MKEKQSFAPVIMAAVLLLLPLLYVASYLVLVNRRAPVAVSHASPPTYTVSHYRCGGTWAAGLYWPLEQVDRRLQPDKWIEPFVY
jgi:hypothetical protein